MSRKVIVLREADRDIGEARLRAPLCDLRHGEDPTGQVLDGWVLSRRVDGISAEEVYDRPPPPGERVRESR